MSSLHRVLIVDDHRMFREGIHSRLERESDIQVVGEAGSAAEALELVQETNPSIVILDIRLPDMSGIELARLLRKQRPDLKILVLTAYDFDQYVRALARTGIDGYLLKDAPQEALVQAIREIGLGGVVLPPHIASKVMRGYASSSRDVTERPAWELTIREIEILELLYEGLRNAQIAERLRISTRTVENHVGSIMGKLGVQSRTEAVRLALEKQLIK